MDIKTEAFIKKLNEKRITGIKLCEGERYVNLKTPLKFACLRNSEHGIFQKPPKFFFAKFREGKIILYCPKSIKEQHYKNVKKKILNVNHFLDI